MLFKPHVGSQMWGQLPVEETLSGDASPCSGLVSGND